MFFNFFNCSFECLKCCIILKIYMFGFIYKCNNFCFFLVFVFGSVILDGFYIVIYFEIIMIEMCESEIFILVYVMYFLFIFVQIFFIFKNYKVIFC